jgi:hypothetical protein
MRIVGLAVVAVVAATAYATGNASALPEFGRCLVQEAHEGKYSNSNCTTKAKKVGEKLTGEFEWHNSTTFTQEGHLNEVGGFFEKTTPLTLTSIVIKCQPNEEHVAKCREGETEERVAQNVECTGGSEQDLGRFSATSDKEIIHYHAIWFGCKALGIPCGNGPGVGTIATNELKGTLGYVKKAAPREVGIDWRPESGREFAKFTCGSVSFIVGGATEREGPFYSPKGGGAVIGTVTPINEMVGQITQVLTANEETAENIPSNFEGKPLQALEAWTFNPNVLGKGSKWGPAGETVTSQITLCGLCDNGVGNTEIKA